MASDDPSAGLTLHSNFARKWAAARRTDPLGHAAATGDKLDHALNIQDSHWGMLGAHMYERNGNESF